MKKIKHIVVGVTAALTLGSAAMAQHAGHGKMTTEQHKQMMASHGSQAEKVTHATGVIRAVDDAKGTITIAHDPIASKNWPAMTMPFKLKKGVLGSIKSGQRVKFGTASVTRIKKTLVISPGPLRRKHRRNPNPEWGIEAPVSR